MYTDSLYYDIVEIFAVLYIFAIIFSLINYVVSGIAYTRIAAKIAPGKIWMAWVPVVNTFCASKYSDEWLGGNLTGKMIGCLIGSFVLSLMSAVFSEVAPFLGLIIALGGLVVSIFSLVYTIKAINALYRCFDPQNAVLFTVLSVFIPLANIILLFIIGSKQPVHPYYNNYNNPQNPGQYPPYSGNNQGYPPQGPYYQQNGYNNQNPGQYNPNQNNGYQNSQNQPPYRQYNPNQNQPGN